MELSVDHITSFFVLNVNLVTLATRNERKDDRLSWNVWRKYVTCINTNQMIRNSVWVWNLCSLIKAWHSVRFQVLTAACMNVTVFGAFMLPSLVDTRIYRRLWGAVLIRATMKAASTSETSVNFYETTRCSTPEDDHFRMTFLFL
jgi:hypothetical protein